jgi:predicted Zn-dependent protease
MKVYFVICLWLVVSAISRADSLSDFVAERERHDSDREALKAKTDPKRIINESSNFLKDREPEMTAEEYALYERVMTMMSTKPDFAVKLLEAMMSDKEPPSPAFEFILGNAYYAAGQSDKAEERYLSTIKRYPTFLRAWINLGVLYYSTKRYDDAVKYLSKSVVLGDRDPQTFGLLGYSLEQLQKIVPAEMAYMQAMSGDPGNVTWLEGLLRIYIQGKQYGRAEWLVKDLIKQQPQETRFWMIYANMLLAQERKAEALCMLETCSAIGASDAQELAELADLYADQGLVPEAIGAYEHLRATSGELGEQKLLAFMKMLTSSRRFPAAEEALSAVEKDPVEGKSAKVMLAKSELLLAENKPQAARTSLDVVLATQPLNGEAILDLGKTYAAEENWPRALLTFEEAANLPDVGYRACLEVATIETRARHYTQAVHYLEKALQIEKAPAVEDFLARVRPLAAKEE